MTNNQQKFLRLAFIEGKKYDDIEKELGIPRKTFAPWWEELKDERERLGPIREKWKAKCRDLSFGEFEAWYENTPKECHYCRLTEEEMQQLWEKYPNLTKRSRGRKLEIERLAPNETYSSSMTNLVFSCYWCNNAKTDTFTEAEFKKMGEVFGEIWKARLDGLVAG